MATIINFFTAICEQFLNVSSKKFCKQIILKICKTSDSKLVWCCDFVHNIIHSSMSMSMCQTPSLSNKDAKKMKPIFPFNTPQLILLFVKGKMVCPLCQSHIQIKAFYILLWCRIKLFSEMWNPGNKRESNLQEKWSFLFFS